MKIMRKAITGSNPAYELYDLGKDPFETSNVFGLAEYTKAGDRLRARLDAWYEKQAEGYPEKLDHSYQK